MPAVLSPVRSGTSEPADPSGPPAPPRADTPPVTPAPPGPPVCDDDEYDADGAGVPGGMFWSWPVDFEALQAALSNPAPWCRDRRDDAGAASMQVSSQADDPSSDAGVRLSDSVVAGRVVEGLPPGPGLAGWLALAEPGELEDGALAGVAASFRRLASWAQAGELAVVAQIAARAAGRDPKAGVARDGRPVQIPRSACSEVALGLALSEYGAAWWTGLGVTLGWRLAATWAAMHDGRIDLARARLIAEHTAVLTDDAARAVEQMVLPGAGDRTTSQLRILLRRAVIAVDPDAAERRREEAERRAKVSLYGEEDHTATLAGSGLPAAQAAAAMARITALARAVKSSGAPGGISLHRAQVFIGLLLGTLPFIPPADGAPTEPPPDTPPDLPPGPEPDGCDRPPAAPGSDGPAGSDGSALRGPVGPGPAGLWEDVPCPGDEDAPVDDDPCPAGTPRPPDEDDEDAGDEDAGEEDRGELSEPAPAWPAVPAVIPPGVIPPALARPGPAEPARAGRPPSGLVDLTVPWTVLAGLSTGPGLLGRIGPITPSQAIRLADAAAADPAAQWRIIVTTTAGQAIAVSRVPHRSRARDGPEAIAGLVGRVTLIISEDDLASLPDRTGPPGRVSPPDRASPPGHDRTAGIAPAGIAPVGIAPAGIAPAGIMTAGIMTAALRAAQRAMARAREQARADVAAGGCAHTSQSDAYRPPPRLQEYVIARDQTCRFPYCRQPAWRGDLDHTEAWPGGPTCRCNLGGLCRAHHQLKQLWDWALRQTRPGNFEWTTPSGRIYPATPDLYFS